MRCVSVTLLLCLATMLLDQVNCQLSGGSTCPCLKTTDRVYRKEDMEGYIKQEAGVCLVDAVLFKAINGRFICGNPQKLWVKRAVEFLDKKKKPAVKTTVRPLNSAPTSTMNNTSHTTG
ncbi:chemokine (C-X-C motif) ligand 32b, duplicate 1 [Carassius gibelio]|uniref:chemokine (C-X-C motif) ligand 32b, duplicate 1 n=1 Tax=Carassius gibelio TaxID=101364 RepID=UPI002277A9B1|nr:chemokine (C-X-C motif) ligand 32b, duplicate 1 [Carassius gibelio]